ncbi:hypothetical protein ONZ51_g2817 [Trametes cubensis]|uniref:DUF6534 domain-containing protein n=1 Tax=Trametes cubensis TaxID=1111947 RepID=A0AAD7TYY6_9APHY|nr:hypothetical protein ONZ51_g2817 [Trametes cubensis]
MATSAEYASGLLSSIKEGIGAWLIGVLMTTFLVGMAVQQTFRYFRLYPHDATYLKAWVVLALILQMFTTALAMHTVYYYLVTYYLNPTVFLKKDVWTSAVVPVFGSLNNLLSESFFARRVYLIGHQYRIIVVSATLMITASCGFFISRTVQAFTLKSVVATTQASGWPPTVASALLLAGDIQLTAVLVYSLHKGRSGIRRTDSMIDLLIAYAISSGEAPAVLLLIVRLLTFHWQEVSYGTHFGGLRASDHEISLVFPRCIFSVLNIVSLILSIVYPHNIIFTASTLVVQGVYTNSFIVALNTRQVVCSRGELEDTNLDTRIVLGEGAPSGTVIDQIALDVQSAAESSMVFAYRSMQSQIMEEGAAAKIGEDSAPSSSSKLGRDEKATV